MTMMYSNALINLDLESSQKTRVQWLEEFYSPIIKKDISYIMEDLIVDGSSRDILYENICEGYFNCSGIPEEDQVSLMNMISLLNNKLKEKL